MKSFFLTFIAGITALAALSCFSPANSGGAKNAASTEPPHGETAGVYYWKTVFSISPEDNEFLKRHNVNRIYLRMFDVCADTIGVGADYRTVPNASVKVGADDYRFLVDSLSCLEFVPVVYVTVDAIREARGNIGRLARNITRRVRNMCEFNALPHVEELQLDCDWTPSTRSAFFALCDSVKQNISELKLPWRLSSTIRLHQLAGRVPPVDCGMLMVYNTGNFSSPDAANSIIDPADVEPYLKHLAKYPLHLDVAYPTYFWQLLFSGRRFLGLLNGVDLTDSTKFTPIGGNCFKAKVNVPYRSTMIRTGNVVRAEQSTFADVARVRQMIDRELSGRPHSSVLYHLDMKNLSQYSPDEIDRLIAPVR